MTTMHIELNESVAKALRERADLAGKTAEQLAAEMLSRDMAAASGNDWIKEFLENARQSCGNSGGWKWNREELYDR